MSWRIQLLHHYFPLGPTGNCHVLRYNVGHRLFNAKHQLCSIKRWMKMSLTISVKSVRRLIRSTICITMTIYILEICYVDFLFHSVSVYLIPSPCLFKDSHWKTKHECSSYWNRTQMLLRVTKQFQALPLKADLYSLIKLIEICSFFFEVKFILRKSIHTA